VITVLIVDDDSNIRLLLRDEFCELGFNTITAVDGEEAQ
jgi:DNA-binding response OmpR family regulator